MRKILPSIFPLGILCLLFSISASAQFGCTDSFASNYNANATFDDGSCLYLTDSLGCTDWFANNYEPEVWIDDGSCLYDTLGCIDPIALNYNSSASVDDGSCVYSNTVFGCTDQVAQNYNPNANSDDGSCTYSILVNGCTDSLALNFDPLATFDDGSCIGVVDSLGCTNWYASNYDTEAWVDDNSCVFDTLGCTDPLAFNYNPFVLIDDGSCYFSNTVPGCTDSSALNFDPNATLNDGSCAYNNSDNCNDPCAPNYNPNANGNSQCLAYSTTCNNDCTLGPITAWDSNTCSCLLVPSGIQIVSGCTDPTACNYNDNANCDDDNCVFGNCGPGCVDPCASNYDPAADSDDGSCLIYNSSCNNDCSLGDIQIWDTNSCACVIVSFSVSGCTDINAINFDSNANCNDGSCSYPTDTIQGCTDIAALNYDQFAGIDDGSCIYSNDSIVFGCTDSLSINFNPLANVDNGTCFGTIDSVGCTNWYAINYDPEVWEDDNSCVFDTLGCMDPIAINYNPYVQIDDGSCFYSNTVLGCTDPAAINYDQSANSDDGSCLYSNTNDCNDPCASNFNPNANGSSECLTYSTDCNSDCAIGPVEIWDASSCACILDVNNSTIVFGCMDPTACNYNDNATCDDDNCAFGNCGPGCTDPCASNFNPAADVSDDSCVFYSTDCNNDCALGDLEVWSSNSCECEVVAVSISGCNDPAAENYNSNANCNDGSCTYDTSNISGCTDPFANNYDFWAQIDNGSCYYTDSVGCTDWFAINYEPEVWIDDGSCIYDDEIGCTDPMALNYAPDATTDSGNCYYSGNTVLGCTNPIAMNYNPAAQLENGSCIFNTTTNPDDTIPGIVFGCLDNSAINFNASASIDDGSCYSCHLGIPIDQGWNIISSVCILDSVSMPDAFSMISSEIVQVKNLVDVYVPELGHYNTIGNWNMAEGYMVKSNSDQMLHIAQQISVPLPYAIQLNTGWNIISFPIDGEADPADVFAGIANNVIQVKNLVGAYVPAFGSNGMGMMRVTQGYQVKMSAPDVLWIDASMLSMRPEIIEDEMDLIPEHYSIEKPLSNRTSVMLIQDPGNNSLIQLGDEIGLFNQDGLLVGSAVYKNEHVNLLMYGNDVTAEGQSGLLDGENFIVKLWQKDTEQEIEIELDFIQGDASFEVNGLAVASFKSDDNIETVNTGIESISNSLEMKLIPNPASEQLNIHLNKLSQLNANQSIRLELFGIDGKQIALVYEGKAKENQMIQYNVSSLNSGVYILKLTNKESIVTERLIVK